MKNRVMMLAAVAVLAVSVMLTGCYSVFSGGTGGRVVDADSTSNPKEGISSVDVYAYVDKKACQKDFDNWKSGEKFKPEAKYYAHTATGSDGSFTISKLMWKSAFPDYWRDGDVTTVYLLYYHDEYGLIKGDETLLLSDSTTNTVYQELKAIRKSTVVNFSVKDVATNTTAGKNLQLMVKVPQGEAAGAAETEYTVTAANGTGAVKITYPRYKADGTTEFTPTIRVSFVESASEVSFKMCKNGGTTGSDYSFDNTAQTATVSGERYDMNLYGKKCRIQISVSGSLGTNVASNDGQRVTLKEGDVEVDAVTTGPVNLGNGVEAHGRFSGLGLNYEWVTGEYPEKILSKQFTVNDKTIQVTSNNSNIYVTLP